MNIRFNEHLWKVVALYQMCCLSANAQFHGWGFPENSLVVFSPRPGKLISAVWVSSIFRHNGSTIKLLDTTMLSWSNMYVLKGLQLVPMTATDDILLNSYTPDRYCLCSPMLLCSALSCYQDIIAKGVYPTGFSFCFFPGFLVTFTLLITLLTTRCYQVIRGL